MLLTWNALIYFSQIYSTTAEHTQVKSYQVVMEIITSYPFQFFLFYMKKFISWILKSNPTKCQRLPILGFHMTSRRPCWCTEKSPLGIWFKIWATFCHCFVHQYGRLITWMKTKNSRRIYLYSFLQFIDNQKTFTGAPYIITDPLDLYPRHLTSVDECRVDSFFIFSFSEESHYDQLMITR